MTDEILKIEGVCLNVDGEMRLKNIDLTVFKGSLTCVYGTVNSGINDLVDILSGKVLPDSGKMEVIGEDINGYRLPWDNMVGTVGKTGCLIDGFTIAENLFVINKGSPFFINRNEISALAENILKDLETSFQEWNVVGELEGAERIVLEVIKLALRGVRVIVIDNTTYFPENASEELYRIVRLFCERGLTFIYVGDYPNPFYEHADAVFSMRDGRMMGCASGLERDIDVFNKMIVKTDAKPSGTPRPVLKDCGKWILSLYVNTPKENYEINIGSGETACIWGSAVVGSFLKETIEKMDSQGITEYEGRIKNSKWIIKRAQGVDMGLLSYLEKKDFVCKNMSIFDNAYLNTKSLDMKAKMGVRMWMRSFFDEEISNFFGKEKNWSRFIKAGCMTLSEQRNLLIYKHMVKKTKAMVILYPTGDIRFKTEFLRNNGAATLLFTDNIDDVGDFEGRTYRIDL